MLTAMQVAEYFLSLSDPDEGDIISNLKLQKLLYYAQGFYLALHDEPLFEEAIFAWMHGPVVPQVYHEFKKYASDALPLPENMDFSIYSQEQEEFLRDIHNIFGQYSAWRLRNMTHAEPPWLEAHEYNGEITHKALKAYFKTQIVEDD